MNETVNQELARAPVGRLMLRFSIPCVLSLLVSALYNIVDQIFIGRGVGYLGNGATNVVFPITVITLALALFVGDGCAAYLSLCQGQGDTESAHRSVGSAVTVTVLCGVGLTLLFALFREPILRSHRGQCLLCQGVFRLPSPRTSLLHVRKRHEFRHPGRRGA